MLIFLKESIQWINLPYTILMGIIIVYWITVIIGLFDVEVMDVEIEMDGFFGMLNIGSLPLSIWLSIFGFQMWLYSILLNLLLGGLGFLTTLLLLRFFLVLVVIAPVSAFITKIVTIPLRKLFADSAVQKKDFIGKECEITSTVVTGNFGTAELMVDNSPQIIDVRSKPQEEIKKGEKVLIFEYDVENDVFLVERI